MVGDLIFIYLYDSMFIKSNLWSCWIFNLSGLLLPCISGNNRNVFVLPSLTGVEWRSLLMLKLLETSAPWQAFTLACFECCIMNTASRERGGQLNRHDLTACCEKQSKFLCGTIKGRTAIFGASLRVEDQPGAKVKTIQHIQQEGEPQNYSCLTCRERPWCTFSERHSLCSSQP